MSARVNVTLRGTALTLEGDYTPANPGSATEPSAPAEFDITAIYIGEDIDDCSSLLSRSYGLLSELSLLALFEIHNHPEECFG